METAVVHQSQIDGSIQDEAKSPHRVSMNLTNTSTVHKAINQTQTAPQPSIWEGRFRKGAIEAVATLPKKRKRSANCALSPARKGKKFLRQPSIDIQQLKPLSGSSHENQSLKKRKRERTPPKETLQSNLPAEERRKSTESKIPLTKDSLRLLEKSMVETSGNSSQKRKASAKRSASSRTEETSQLESATSTRSLAPNDARFELALWQEKNVNFRQRYAADEQDIEEILRALRVARNSPEPDSASFYQARHDADYESEEMVKSQITATLLPYMRVRSEHPLLCYRANMAWGSWGSFLPKKLPTPQPDVCISFNATLAFTEFTKSQLALLPSPYVDGAGLAPVMTWEVKTSKEGTLVPERQNANNAMHALEQRFLLIKTIDFVAERENKILFWSVVQDTKTLRIYCWFYKLRNEVPMWCFEPMLVSDFSVSREGGFIKARQYALNLCDYLMDRVYQELLSDVREASKIGSRESLGLNAALAIPGPSVQSAAVLPSGPSSTEEAGVAGSNPPKRPKHS